MVGTHGVGRLAAMVVALAVVLLLVLADTARAGTYRVAQCGWGIGAELDPSWPKTEGPSAFLHPSWCTSPPAGVPAGVGFSDGLAGDGEQGLARARWVAPPGTNFAGVRFVWSSEMAAGVWQVAGIDDGTDFYGLAAAGASKPPTQVTQGVSGPAGAFEARLECLLLGPRVGCDRSVYSTMTLRDLVLTIDDPVPPKAQLGGALVASGWHRGKVALELGAEDPVGAGVAREEATIDGVAVLAGTPGCAVQTIDGEVLGTRLRPCPPSATQAAEVDTTRFGDGLHTLRGCAADLGGGQGCAPEARVGIDNSPPGVEFGAAPDGQVAVIVSDAYSGPASGTIAMRRADAGTWTDLPTTLAAAGSGTATLSAPLPELSAGAYFFRATAADSAGNLGSAQFRAAGSPEGLRRQISGAGASGPGPAPRGGGRASGARGRATHLTAHLVEVGGGAAADRGLAARGGLAALAGTAAKGDLVTLRGGAVKGGLAARGGTPALSDAAVSGATARWTGAARRETLADRRSLRRPNAGSPLTVDYGTGAELRGRLTGPHGDGVAERPVLVVVRAAAGSRSPERHRLVTDGAGRFVLRLAPGTSRRLLVAFHGGGGFAPARERSLSLRVRAGVDLLAEPLRLRTGESVSLSGRVRPGPARIPARGKLVTIQYLERASGRWRPALVVRTDPRGRFATRYRFRYVTGEARIHLRATALPEAGWPYAEGSSPPVVVRVRG